MFQPTQEQKKEQGEKRDRDQNGQNGFSFGKQDEQKEKKAKFDINTEKNYYESRINFFNSISRFIQDYRFLEGNKGYWDVKDDKSKANQIIKDIGNLYNAEVSSQKLLSSCYSEMQSIASRATMFGVKNLANALLITFSDKLKNEAVENEKHIEQIYLKSKSEQVSGQIQEKIINQVRDEFKQQITEIKGQNEILKMENYSLQSQITIYSEKKEEFQLVLQKNQELEYKVRQLEEEKQQRILFEKSEIIKSIQHCYEQGLFQNAYELAKSMYETPGKEDPVYKELYWLALTAYNLKALSKYEEFQSIYASITVAKSEQTNTDHLVRKLSTFFDNVISLQKKDDKKKGLAQVFESFFEAKLVPDVKPSCEEKYKNIKNGMSVENANKIFSEQDKSEQNGSSFQYKSFK